MVTFLGIDIRSQFTKEEIFEICRETAPELKWRMGESDAGGGYVSGSKPGVRIQCWTGENPISLSLSFLESASPEERERWVLAARNVLGPRIGTVEKLSQR